MSKRPSDSENSPPTKKDSPSGAAPTLTSDKVTVVFVPDNGFFSTATFWISDLPDDVRERLVARLVKCKTTDFADHDYLLEGKERDTLRAEIGYLIGELNFDDLDKDDFAGDEWMQENYDRLKSLCGTLQICDDKGATEADTHLMIISTWL